MKYKIAICDDSDADRQYVLNMVDRWAASAGHVIHTDTFTSAENFLFHYAEESDYDILLLDIEMGAMDGVTMAKQLRQSNDTVQIVFITGYSDYISEGYEVAALHYLMKPVKEEKLCAVLDRAVEKLSKNEKVLNFEIGGEMVRVPIYQIRYADVFGNYVTIHAMTDVTVKMTLGELEKQLDERFYRVGRSTIINLTQISRVTKIKMKDGTETYLYKDFDTKNGVDVSGGEAQKIAIARALYKDAPFIILDEPTAALDPIAEAEIYGKFDEIAGDKTAIYISHRLSSCKFCDEIAVFHEGAVIQQGSHASLVADESGKYYELWNAQAQYYTE